MGWGIFEDDARRYLDSLIYQRQVDQMAKSGDKAAMGIALVAREMGGEHVAPRRRKRKRQRPEKQKRFGSARKVRTDTDIKEQLTMEKLEKLLTASDLAEILGFAHRSVINMAREKPHTLPPYIRVSDSYRWRPSVVQAWMDDKSQTVQKEREVVTVNAAQPKRGRGRPRK